jgi:hypothetical protein
MTSVLLLPEEALTLDAMKDDEEEDDDDEDDEDEDDEEDDEDDDTSVSPSRASIFNTHASSSGVDEYASK